MTWRDGKVVFVPKSVSASSFFHWKKCVEVRLIPLKKCRGLIIFHGEKANIPKIFHLNLVSGGNFINFVTVVIITTVIKYEIL